MMRIFSLIFVLFFFFFGCDGVLDSFGGSNLPTTEQLLPSEEETVTSPPKDNLTEESENLTEKSSDKPTEILAENSPKEEDGTNHETPEDKNQVTERENKSENNEGINQESDQNGNSGVSSIENPDKFSGTIWVDGVTKETGWIDVDKWKGYVSSSELHTCWMATSANVLMDYYRRNRIDTNLTASQVYDKIYGQNNGDVEGTYINGVWQYVEKTGVGLIYPPSMKRNCLWETNEELISQALIKYLKKGAAGIKFIWKNGGGTGHALTLWGAEFKEGILTKIYVTDSDDRAEGIAEYEVKHDGKNILVPKYILGSAYLREVYIPF